MWGSDSGGVWNTAVPPWYSMHTLTKGQQKGQGYYRDAKHVGSCTTVHILQIYLCV